MKIIITTILLLSLSVAVCRSQTVPNTVKITRSEAVKMGLQNRFDVKANDYDISLAKTRINKAKNNWLPEISADGQFKYSPQLQNAVIPGGVLPGFDQTTILPLMVSNQTVFSLNLTQPIINAGLTNDVKIAKNHLALQEEKNRAAKIDIMLSISRAYLDATLRGLQKKIATAIAARNKEYEQIALGMYRNGSLIENHYLRAKLDRENAVQLQKQSEQNYELGLLQLRYQLNLPENATMELVDSLGVPDAVLSTDMQIAGDRTELRQLEILQQDHQLNVKKFRQDALPSLSFGANYSQQFLSKEFNYGTGKWWSPFSYLTLNLHIPLSTHYKNKVVITEYKQWISQNELLLQQKKSDIAYEVQQARTTLSNAISNWRNAQNSYLLSQTIFSNQQQQFRLGAFDYSALLDTEKSLSITERNYIQSAYELTLAQIQLQKATNNFTTN